MKKKINYTKLELQIATLFKIKKKDLKKEKINILGNLDSLDILNLLDELKIISKNKIELDNLMKFKNFKELQKIIKK